MPLFKYLNKIFSDLLLTNETEIFNANLFSTETYLFVSGSLDLPLVFIQQLSEIFRILHQALSGKQIIFHSGFLL